LAYSKISYSADGMADSFTVPFEYISQVDVQVSVNGVLKTLGTDYTFPSSSYIKFNAKPTGTVFLQRITPRDHRLVDFQDATVLTESDLDTSAKQSLFIAQESLDTAVGALRVPDTEGTGLVIPAQAVRVNTLLGFDSSGFPVPYAAGTLPNVPLTSYMAAALTKGNASALLAYISDPTTTQALSVGTATLASHAVRKDQLNVGSALSFLSLTVSASGTTSNISIAADELLLRGTDGSPLMTSHVNATLNSNTVGLGGLDTGTLSTSTWYSVWVISNGSTIGIIASLSPTNPTLPAGFTYKARVGWFRTDTTTNKYPLPFIQFGRNVIYSPTSASSLVSYPIMAANYGTAIGLPVATAAFIPPTAVSLRYQAVLFPGTASNSVAGFKVGATDQALSAQSGSWAMNNFGNTSGGEIMLVAPQGSIQYSLTVSSGGSLTLSCAGWMDNL
jgi:hypothetical protein